MYSCDTINDPTITESDVQAYNANRLHSHPIQSCPNTIGIRSRKQNDRSDINFIPVTLGVIAGFRPIPQSTASDRGG